MNGFEHRVAGAVIKVQVCGQLETLQLEHLTTQTLTAAVERRFEVRPPFLFVDRDGRQFHGDDALRACAELGGVVLVKLTEGVMHDFGRRIDQFRHLQWGYLADQLATARRDQEYQREDTRSWQTLIEQEQGHREALRQETQRQLEDLRELLRSEHHAREIALQGLEAHLVERQTFSGQQGDKHTSQLTTLQHKVHEIGQELVEERRTRDQTGVSTSAELHDLRRQLQGGGAEQEAAVVRLQKEVASLNASLESASGSWKAEAAELRQQNAVLRQSFLLEQRERAAADADAMGSAAEASRAAQQEAAERQAEHTSLVAKLRELEGFIDVAKVEARKATAEMASQLSMTFEGLQEKQSLQAHELSNFSQGADVLRKMIDQDAQEREIMDAKVNRLAHDVAKRCDDEVRSREADTTRVLRALAEESDRRQEADRKISRMVTAMEEGTGADADLRAQEGKGFSVSVEQCRAALSSEQADRMAAQQELLDKLAQYRRLLAEEQQQRQTEREELRAELFAQVNELRSADEAEARARWQLNEQMEQSGIFSDGRAARRTELVSATEELRERLDRESRQREMAISSLSQKLLEVGEAVMHNDGRSLSGEEHSGYSDTTHGKIEQMVRTSCAALRTECLAMSSSSIQEFRIDVQQDTRSQSEALVKLREDCKEAMQREIRARMDKDQQLQESLEREAMTRAQAVEMLEATSAEVQQSLETHTHEMHIEGPGQPPGMPHPGMQPKRSPGMEMRPSNMVMTGMHATEPRAYNANIPGPGPPSTLGGSHSGVLAGGSPKWA